MSSVTGRSKSLNITTTNDLKNNGTLYAHVYLISAISDVTPRTLYKSPQAGMYKRFDLVKYMVLKQPKDTFNLLDGDKVVETERNAKIITGHWLPNLTLALVEEYQTYRPGSIPPHIKPHLTLLSDGTYMPILHKNDFWVTRECYVPLNDTVHSIELHMTLESLSSWKWQLFMQMDTSFEMQKTFGADDGSADEFKHMLVDNNPVVLVITFSVSILHSIFEFLAFKNDIAFWKNTKNIEGLSVKSIFVQLFSQVVIFLYLLDHEETSWMILIPAFIGILIEGWKITKAVIVSIEWKNGLPRLSLTDRDTYKSKTKKIDEVAMQYLSYLMFPLVIGYAVYSLYYDTHKSWYSWILSSLTGAIYTFGFIMMTPQLFINYKLKSVAHLPWRVFVYKAINTFIDDLFAWVIRMPTMHRIATLRDDVVFLVFLYQKWIYRVDYSRPNEYGQVLKTEKEKEEVEKEKED